MNKSEQLSISDQLRFEFCNRGTLATLAFVTGLSFMLIFPLVTSEQFQIPHTMAVLVAIALNLGRWVHARAFRNSPQALVQTFPYHALYVIALAMVLGFAMCLSFLDTQNSPYIIAFAYLFCSGLFASSIATVSYVPVLQFVYGVLMMWIPVTLASLARYNESNIFQVLPWVNSVFIFYILLASRIFYNGLVKRLAAEQSLQIEKRNLKEAYDNLKLTQLELDQQKSLAEYSVKMAALGQMAGGIAHEINSPLAIIQVYNEQIQVQLKKPTPDLASVDRYAGVIQKTTDRIAKIIKGLRTFSRDGSRDDFQKFSVQKMVENTLALSRERFVKANIDFQVEPFEEFEINGREIQFSQVLLNLLNNAYDASLKSENPWVRLEVKTDSEFVEFSVADSGPRIPPQVERELFRPFFTTKEIGKGSGLGLSISYGIVEEHGGKLFYDKASSHTRFVCRFPVAALQANLQINLIEFQAAETIES